MVAATGAPHPGEVVGAPTTTPAGDAGGPPIIQIDGDNPAAIQVGAIYADLGATITGPTADLNLGLTTLLDGATTTSLQLDTSTPGTHTIEYTVTDPKGLTGTASRTIIVSAPANDNTPLAPLSATGTEATTTTQ